MTKKNDQMLGEMLHDEPMSRHTSWRVGGPADRYYKPANLDDLVRFLKELKTDEPLMWVGLGSNLLVRDGGIRGTVIAPTGRLKVVELVDEKTIRAEVGVTSAKVARFSVDNGLKGAEFLAGIPGTIGGALAMNAGAFGGETWRIVQAVETVDRRGVVHQRLKNEFEVGYRHVEQIEGEWFVAAHFLLEKDDDGAGKETIRSLLGRRGNSQPTQTANAGSVFKNPPGDHAARLIETAGLKGTCHGGACVSEMHANFIINTGSATAGDIETLILKVQQTVAEKHDVMLEPEVRIVGERQ